MASYLIKRMVKFSLLFELGSRPAHSPIILTEPCCVLIYMTPAIPRLKSSRGYNAFTVRNRKKDCKIHNHSDRDTSIQSVN